MSSMSEFIKEVKSDTASGEKTSHAILMHEGHHVGCKCSNIRTVSHAWGMDKARESGAVMVLLRRL